MACVGVTPLAQARWRRGITGARCGAVLVVAEAARCGGGGRGSTAGRGPTGGTAMGLPSLLSTTQRDSHLSSLGGMHHDLTACGWISAAEGRI